MAYIALYNKYRPRSFAEVVGQQSVVRVLKNQVQMGMISHAYLFSGPRGTGKTTMARLFAKAINCQSPKDGEACGECSTCIALAAKNNLDIIEIDAASNTGVNDIRTLRENVKYMPVSAKYRVYIIDEVHMLSVNAFNALLKTLEEPPEHIVFIMATTEPHKLPVTVLSRCQKFEFTRIPTVLIAQYLTELSKKLGIKAEKNALFAIARASAGGMRDAVSLLDQMTAMGESKIDTKLVSETLGSADKLLYFALCEAILSEDISRAIGGLYAMIQKGCSASTIASDLMQMFRDLYIAQCSPNVENYLVTDDASADRLRQLAGKVSAGSLLKCLEIFSSLENDLRYAVRPEIWLELAIGKACRVQKEESYEALLQRVEILEKKLENGIVQREPKAPAPKIEKPQDEFFPIKDEDVVPKKKEVQKDESHDDGYDSEAYAAHNMGYEPPSDDGEEDYVPYDDTPVFEPEEPVQKITEPEVQASSAVETVATAPNEAVAVEPEEGVSATNEDGEGDLDAGRRIWNEATEKIRAQKVMRLHSPMKKAQVAGYDGSVIRVTMSEKDETSAKRFENSELKDILTKALKEASGHHLQFEVKVEKLTQEENDFMKQVFDVFPDDIVSIE